MMGAKMKGFFFVGIVFFVSLTACKKENNGSDSGGISHIFFNPVKGSTGIPVFISGIRFDSIPGGNTVFFNGIKATIFQSSDTLIGAYVPVGVSTGRIRVTVNGASVTSASDFVILDGTWTKMADLPLPFPTNPRALGIGFAIGNTGYIGFGTDSRTDFDDLYAYDPSTNTWSQKASLGLAMEGPAGFVINNKAYIGFGYSKQVSDVTNDFYEYDPPTNTWTRRADFPGTARTYPVGISIGNLGYVGLGQSKDGNFLIDVWQYDPTTDTWLRKADFPGTAPPVYPFGFSLNDSTGYAGGPLLQTGDIQTVLWQYSSRSDQWKQKRDFPGDGSLFANSLVIQGNAYVMGGGVENWLYDPVADNWVQKAFFDSRSGGSTFAIGVNGYYGCGSGLDGLFNHDLWQFTP
jgi:N-acetylneuraminic acid mutarotase